MWNIETTAPILSKREYIALEITKALIANNQLANIGMDSLIAQADNAARQILESTK